MDRLLEEALSGAECVVLLGHLHPDGDCIGSCLGLYNALAEEKPDLKVDLFLEEPSEKFSYLKNFDKIQTKAEEIRPYDLCITLDASDSERLGMFLPLFEQAAKTFCIDHHITNKKFAEENYVLPEASSCAEVLCTLLDPDQISKETAECLYTGMVHDTGVFKFSNTSAQTMEMAGKMVAKGVDCAEIIDGSFYRKTYIQNRLLGKALLNSALSLDGKCIESVLSLEELEQFGADTKDTDGIIDQLRITDGVECAVFIYEKTPGEYKVSMRSNHIVDVSRIASSFGGGGHIRAAGCSASGEIDTILKEISKQIKEQLDTPDQRDNGADQNV